MRSGQHFGSCESQRYTGLRIRGNANSRRSPASRTEIGARGDFCLPEQPQLGQQGWVGAALLGAGLTRRVMLGAETPDLCQDLPGESRKTRSSAREPESDARRSGKIKRADLPPLAFYQVGGENQVKTGRGEMIFYFYFYFFPLPSFQSSSSSGHLVIKSC